MDYTVFSKEFPNVKVFYNEPLKKYTFTKTGGNAAILIFPKDKQEASEVTHWLRQQNIPTTILGNASNVIIKDGGISGAVIMLNDMSHLKVDGTKIVAEGGVALIDVSKEAAKNGLTGLEFACGIPGSVGGAIYMNAGAYGGEVSEVVEYVEVITPEGYLKTYSAEELEFSYRHSFIQNTGDLVIEVGFQLEKGNQEEIDEKIAELTHLRQSKQPLEYPSCGSVFKRPEGYFTGKLIQDAGLQGYQIGGAQVSKKHAGFIVNIDNATATDYMDLIRYIQKVILEKDGVSLEPEVRIIGEEPTSH